jgi:hypothetical protein
MKGRRIEKADVFPVRFIDSAFVFLQEGQYTITDSSGGTSLLRMEKPFSQELGEGWEVSFPENHGAPKKVRLNVLSPLNEHTDVGVKYFSGTCAYRNVIAFKGRKKKSRYFIDLGKVEVLAEVIINGKSLGVIWTSPFIADVTDALVNGENEIVVKVTNQWINRLIGDAQGEDVYRYSVGGGGGPFASLSRGAIEELPDWYQKGLPKPDDGKIAFSTWKHYHKDSPLVSSGLIGPVRIFEGRELGE